MVTEPSPVEILGPSTRAKLVTAVVMGTAGFLLVRRLPRPLRPAADLALAAGSPYVAAYLTKLGL
jgi:hypothetical protein